MYDELSSRTGLLSSCGLVGMNIQKVHLIVSGLLVTLAMVFSGSVIAHADIDDLTTNTGCTNQPSYTGELTLAAGTYDVFVQLGRRGEQANVSTYVQADNQAYGKCTKLGKAKVKGLRWQKVGVFKAKGERLYTLQLASEAMANMPDANRPSVMLVPHSTKPLCTMTDECYISLFGEKAYLRPTGTLLNENSLHALVVTDPSKDTIKEVRYYTGKTLAYTSSTLEPFKTRYIEYGGQELTRVISYASGQQAVIETTASVTHQDTFYNFLFRLTQRYPDTLQAIAWLVGGLIICAGVFVVTAKLRSAQAIRAHHGFRANLKPTLWQRAVQAVKAYRIPGIFHLVAAGLAIVMAVGILIIIINTYALQIMTVDGRSMEKSYVTGNQVLVNKLPKVVAAFNNREYLPNRGDVVIVRASFGNTILTEGVAQDLTLIKRVIGLPNERVVIKDGTLTVYNPLHPKGFQPDKNSPWEAQMTKDPVTEDIDIELGPSEIFVSGDNRPESIDSRFNGPLSTSEIIGVVAAKW